MPPTNLSAEEQKEKDLLKWQKTLLPWMVMLPTVLIGVFIVLATLRINNFEKYIYQDSDSFIDEALPDPSKVEIDSLVGKKLEYKWLERKNNASQGIEMRCECFFKQTSLQIIYMCGKNVTQLSFQL